MKVSNSNPLNSLVRKFYFRRTNRTKPPGISINRLVLQIADDPHGRARTDTFYSAKPCPPRVS